MSDKNHDTGVKPNHSTAYGGMLLALVIAVFGLFIHAESDEASWVLFGQLLIIAAVVGVFIMIGAIAIVDAIHKRS